jgi:isocitrate dehydrogenase (NAD+)
VAGEAYSSDSVVFEPGARHSFSQAVGKNVANPGTPNHNLGKLLPWFILTTSDAVIKKKT